MKRRLDDMVVVITGASSGIGRALAENLSTAGARLVLAARRLDRLEELCQSLGGRHLCCRADVSNQEDCQQIISAAQEKFGRIDTLVCSAGFARVAAVTEISDADCRKLMDTNLFGTIHCLAAAVPIMRRQEERDGYQGQIMIVSSAAARRGVPYLGMYAATKAAQLSIAEAARIELKGERIAITSVHPVITETDFFTTADKLSGVNMAALANGQTQSAARVAAYMARAIQRPRRELWPAPFSRLCLDIAVALPAVVDFFMSRMQRRFLRDNSPAEAVETKGQLSQKHAPV